MRDALPAVFQRLREIGAPVVQYKVCSTFDSAPQTGSIGCALEIGQEVFGVPCVPVVPAAPLLGRYVVFGNLFAADGHAIHRIDRHPTMREHPITPMDESDLLVHLGRQTDRRVARVNLLELRGNSFRWPEAEVVLFDGLDTSDMAQAARRIWGHRSTSQRFVVGSSGFTYGMLDYWRGQGWLRDSCAGSGQANVRRSDERLLVLAGSCSPVTERQIRSALRAGFHGIRLNPAELNAAAAEAEAVAQLASGRNVILYGALGSGDRVAVEDGPALATAMGRLLRKVILASRVGRVLVAGGDTASFAARELGVSALTFAAPLVRGAPVCRAHGGPADLELVLKGGQIGRENFFEEVQSWTP
jgi:uncharacterized protein YgbK (DUF1537 family)